MGAGHAGTALYELIPADSAASVSGIDPLRYQESTVLPSDDLLTLKLRYKQPDGDTSQLVQQALQREDIWQTTPSENMQFASAVAEFGLLLRNSEYKADADYEAVFIRAAQSRGADIYGYRAEFLDLVQQADLLSR